MGDQRHHPCIERGSAPRSFWLACSDTAMPVGESAGDWPRLCPRPLIELAHCVAECINSFAIQRRLYLHTFDSRMTLEVFEELGVCFTCGDLSTRR